MDESNDGVIWVHKVEDPRAFGVVKLNDNNIITDFVEKPEEFVSDLAIIGIYYFKDGGFLKKELQHFIDCVRNNKTPLVSGNEAKEALKVALEISKKIWAIQKKRNKKNEG